MAVNRQTQIHSFHLHTITVYIHAHSHMLPQCSNNSSSSTQCVGAVLSMRRPHAVYTIFFFDFTSMRARHGCQHTNTGPCEQRNISIGANFYSKFLSAICRKDGYFYRLIRVGDSALGTLALHIFACIYSNNNRE